MGKATRTRLTENPTSGNGSSRSPEPGPAAAIAQRDEADAHEAAMRHARERAREDLFKANRAVEAAEAALADAREAARASLVDAYVDGEAGDDASARMPIADAEAALDRVQRRVAEMQTIVDELNAPPAPGWSIPNARMHGGRAHRRPSLIDGAASGARFRHHASRISAI